MAQFAQLECCAVFHTSQPTNLLAENLLVQQLHAASYSETTQ